MSDSKILMLPEYGYGNNANNLGLGGWGGGILGFILGILLGNNGIDENSEEAAYLIGYIVKRMYIGITNIY